MKCDGTVPNRHYRVPQFVVLRDELHDFITADLRSGKSILAPDYAGLLDLKRIDALSIIALQRGTFDTGADGMTPYEFFERYPDMEDVGMLPLTPEDIHCTVTLNGIFGIDEVRDFYCGSKISRISWLFKPKCRNNAELTYILLPCIAIY